MALASTQSGAWIVDSGATAHMTPMWEWFSSILSCKETITLGDSHTVPVAGMGQIPLFHSTADSKYKTVEALFVPDLAFNLLSVASLDAHGAHV